MKNEEQRNACRAKVLEVLSVYSAREVGESTLYFIDSDGDVLLRSLEEDYNGEAGIGKKQRGEFAQVVNLLNPKNPAHSYTVGIREKYRQITHKDTVKEYIEGEYEVWKNTYLKNTRELIALHSPADEESLRMQADAAKAIDLAGGELGYILTNYDDLVVKITAFSHSKAYPYIQYMVRDRDRSKPVNKHLSIVAPNALYYTPAVYRSDMKIEEFIKQAKNPFGDIYYMNKEKTE